MCIRDRNQLIKSIKGGTVRKMARISDSMLGATTIGTTGVVSSTVYLFTEDALLISLIAATTITLGILFFTVSKRYAKAKNLTAANADVVSFHASAGQPLEQKKAA
jgi:hypothetical protein